MTNDTLLRSGGAGVGSASAPIAATGNMAVSMSGLLAQWLRGLTINAHERLAIAHLWEHGSMTMSELGSRIPLSRAAVTALTDRLEALGYVLRTPDEHDRRRTVLSITPRPAALIDQFVQAWTREVEAFEASFSADEQRAVVRWSEGVREISHRFAAELRTRRDDELPVAEEVNRR
ncbi:MAG: transcriptional regulator, MarR family [Thermoleophilia bacterium]|nr:transcriptional regulator, MarR family [Thermoleophilia bacterium]MCZ4497375.1 transcriptional regulator, MarR family [Thermoleophilia bacterium]